MPAGTSFHYVTDGFDAAYARALDVASGNAVDIAGGASTDRQRLNAGVIDELSLPSTSHRPTHEWRAHV
jgi:dihydrofolate reductase